MAENLVRRLHLLVHVRIIEYLSCTDDARPSHSCLNFLFSFLFFSFFFFFYRFVYEGSSHPITSISVEVNHVFTRDDCNRPLSNIHAEERRPRFCCLALHQPVETRKSDRESRDCSSKRSGQCCVAAPGHRCLLPSVLLLRLSHHTPMLFLVEFSRDCDLAHFHPERTAPSSARNVGCAIVLPSPSLSTTLP